MRWHLPRLSELPLETRHLLQVEADFFVVSTPTKHLACSRFTALPRKAIQVERRCPRLWRWDFRRWTSNRLQQVRAHFFSRFSQITPSSAQQRRAVLCRAVLSLPYIPGIIPSIRYQGMYVHIITKKDTQLSSAQLDQQLSLAQSSSASSAA